VAVSVVDVQVNAQGAVRGLNQVNIASRAAEAGVRSLKGAVLGLTAGFTALSAIRLVVGKTAELEKQTRSLQTLTGSVQEAKRIISDLQQLGAVTPFTSAELIDAAKRLQAFGVEAKNVVETTRRLADVSGATGAELQGLVTAFGQVQAKGRLQGEELLQFQERGIALQEELRRMYGMTGQEFQKALGKGRISAEAVEVAIINLTDKGGKYANGAIAQSTTLEGKFSTLTDGVDEIARKIGQTLQPALKEILDLAILVINKINEALAGPDYKKANDRLFNTRATIKELTLDIEAAEKAGVGMAQGLQIQGVDGQVLAPSVPVLPRMKADLKTLQKEAKTLEERLSELRRAAAPSKAKPKPETPELLSGVDPTAKGRTKKERESQAPELTRELGLLQQQTQLQGLLAQAALAKNKEDEIRLQGIGRETELLYQALAIEQSSVPLKEKQLGAAKIAEQLAQSQIQTARELALLDLQQRETGFERISNLEDEQKLLLAKLQGTEAEEILRQQLRDIMKDTKGLDEGQVKALLDRNNALKQQVEAATQLKQLYADIGMSIKDGVVGAIQGAIDGTKSLQEVATNLLSNIANKLLDVAVNMALFGALSGTGTGGGLLGGLFKRAGGGSVMAGQGYLVGERGPELFMPGRSGGIAPAGSFGGGTNITVNVDAKGSSVQGNAGRGDQLARAVAMAVQAELIKQKRPGGILA